MKEKKTMEWVKIKAGHVYGPKLTLLQIGALVLIQAMTAHFERIPTPEERREVISDWLLDSLRQALERQSTTLQEVLDEVLEDVRRVMENKAKDKRKIQNWRNKRKKEAVLPVSVTDKNRIEENRIEERNGNTSLTPVPEPEPGTERILGPEEVKNMIGQILGEIK